MFSLFWIMNVLLSLVLNSIVNLIHAPEEVSHLSRDHVPSSTAPNMISRFVLLLVQCVEKRTLAALLVFIFLSQWILKNGMLFNFSSSTYLTLKCASGVAEAHLHSFVID